MTDPARASHATPTTRPRNLTHTTMPNGTSETRQYDSLNRLVYLENDGPSGVISSYRYTLDADGNRTKVVENTGRTVLYAYDALAPPDRASRSPTRRSAIARSATPTTRSVTA